MNVSVKQATTADAALIADLSRQTFYDTFAPFNTADDMELFMTKQFTRETLMMEPALQENIFLLAYNGEAVVGYAKLTAGKKPPAIKNKNAIEIARLYAVKESIGLGVGKALMQHCIGLAAQMKKDLIWLGVWEDNERAISFYQNWGFEKFADSEFILGNDVQNDWLMKKVLSAPTS